jgi:hypothetical protein
MIAVQAMPKVAPQEFLTKPFRAHSFLSDVSLHDVWAVDLPGTPDKATLQEFYRRVREKNASTKIAWPARALLGLRFFLGMIFRWDQEPARRKPAYFAERLTAEDRERSAVPAGTPEKFFRLVYSFEDEVLLEVINRTVHAAMLSALAQTPTGYRYYLAVYVHALSWFTRPYMALIDPFRKWLVYPALLKQVQATWEGVFLRDAEPAAGFKER